jgi:hypothetical protein
MIEWKKIEVLKYLTVEEEIGGEAIFPFYGSQNQRKIY